MRDTLAMENRELSPTFINIDRPPPITTREPLVEFGSSSGMASHSLKRINKFPEIPRNFSRLDSKYTATNSRFPNFLAMEFADFDANSR